MSNQLLERVASQPGRLAVRPPSQRDWLIAVAVATFAAAVILATSGRLWFFSDAWPILANRRLSTFDGWTKPHGGHWLIAPTVGAKLSLRLFGQDFFPGYFIPRVVLYGLLSLAWWRVLRWRDVPQVVALASILLIGWLGTTGWIITVIYIGPIVVGLCAIGAAWIIDDGDASRNRQIALFLLTALAVSSSASGPALWAAVFLVALLTKQLKPFAIPIGASGLLYAWWYLTIARNDPNPLTPKFPGVGDFVTAPLEMTKLIGIGLGAPFRLDAQWQYLMAALFYVGVAVLWRTGRLRRFDAVMLMTGLIIVALGVLVRGAQGARVDAPNRVYLVTAYLLIGLLPAALSGIRKTPAIVAAVALALFAVPNLAMATDQIEVREGYISQSRERIETAIALIDDGAAYIPWSSVSPQATNRSLQTLIYRGWESEGHPELAEEVQGQMMIALNRGHVVRKPFLQTTDDFDPATNCMQLEGNRDYVFTLTGTGAITISDAMDEVLSLTRGGEAVFTRDITAEHALQGITYAATAGQADNTLTINGHWPANESRELCGVIGKR